MKKSYSKDYQTNIFNRYLSGISITNLSKETGIARSTIYRWINSYQKSLAKRKTINLREVFDLKQKCEQQEKMIEILQTASCSASASLRERYDAIQELEDKYSINLLCKTLKVAKGSYYNHILRNKNEDTLAAQKRAELTPIIEELFHESNETYGSGKIHAILKDRGYKVAPDTVASIMHDNGWFSVVGGAKKLYLLSQERKQNIVQQNFNVSRPNEVWVGDVTMFRYNDKTYYICVILDLFARKAVAFRISSSNSTQLTKSTFKLAYEKRLPTDLIFHSDQGCNYTSRTYMEYLRQLGVKQSFSKKHTPYDNSVMESFFKTMKTEKLYRTDFKSEREIKEGIKQYIYYYNEKRHHSIINYQTPNSCEAKYFSKMRQEAK